MGMYLGNLDALDEDAVEEGGEGLDGLDRERLGRPKGEVSTAHAEPGGRPGQALTMLTSERNKFWTK